MIKKKILIVDDHAEIRKLVRTTFQDRFDILEAMDGISAEQTIRDQLPDLVLLDVMMPNMGGLQVLRNVKQDPDPALQTVQFIMLTACAEQDYHEIGHQFGVVQYILKPFSPSILSVIVDELLLH